MKIAHIRERNAPAGAPFRLAAAADAAGERWLDLEVARRRAVRRNERLAHDSPLFRQPITTLDALLAAGLRVEVLRDVLERHAAEAADAGDAGDADDDAVFAAAELRFGPPILRPPSFRDFYAFERHVATMWRRRDQEIPEAWYRLPIFYFSNTSEIRGPGDPVWAPRGSTELDYELEVCALIDTPARDVDAASAEQVIGGFCILNDWSARDLQRDESAVRLGPAKGKDFAATFGPWLVTPDELEDARSAKGYDLAMTATVGDVHTSRGNWSTAHFSFGEMLARASADVRLRPGDLIGSGTVGGGCLLEIKDERLGRWLQPGDEVTLSIDRLGSLRSPVVEHP